MLEQYRLRCAVIGLIGGGVTLLLLLAIPQLALIRTISTIDALPGARKVLVIAQALGSSFTVIPWTHQIVMVSIIVLAGVNTWLAARLFVRRRRAASAHLSGLAGVLAAILGAGCSACGSAVFISLIGLSAASPLLASLPFHGFEFSISSMLLSVMAFFLLVRETRSAGSCKLASR